MQLICIRKFSCGFLCLWDDCHTVSYDVIFKDRARISTHWCSEVPAPAVKIEVTEPQPEIPQPEAPASEAPPPETPQSRRKKRQVENYGFMFNGLFDTNQVNPFTGGPNCPGHYQPYKMSLNVTVCLSRDYQLDAPYSIGFSGFFSCQTPSAQKQCLKGYSQHLATVAEGCDIYYCVKPEAFVFMSPALIKRYKNSRCRTVGRLGHLVDPDSWSTGHLADRTVGRPDTWSTGHLVDRTIDRPDTWPTGQLVDRTLGRLDSWSTGHLADRTVGRPDRDLRLRS
uniref:Uncharacterized protein n=1 Tax=Acrobeloides nanus TaxID=290746 RepID=A0A914E586_9BILA